MDRFGRRADSEFLHPGQYEAVPVRGGLLRATIQIRNEDTLDRVHARSFSMVARRCPTSPHQPPSLYNSLFGSKAERSAVGDPVAEGRRRKSNTMGEPSLSLFHEACGALGPLHLEVAGEGEETRHHFLPQPFALIGRDARADVSLLHEQVSRRHVYLQVIAGRVFCVDLGSRFGIRWEKGNRLSGWIDGTRSVGIGPYRIKPGWDDQAVACDEADSADLPSPLYPQLPGPAGMPVVVLEALNVRTRPSWQMNPVLALVGRSHQCQVRISDGRLSRCHCSLLRTPLGVWVVDLLGKDGIQVNGLNVRSERLDEGDELRVGKVLLRIRYIPTSAAENRVDISPWTGTITLISPMPHTYSPTLEVRPKSSRERSLEVTHPLPRLPRRVADVELMPASWLAPVPEPSQILIERPAEPSLELFAQQFDQMQRQMSSMQQQMSSMQQQICGYFPETIIALFQAFGAMHRDQMDVVHAELDQIRRLSEELKVLRARSAPSPFAPSELAPVAAVDHSPTDLVAQVSRPDGTAASQVPPCPTSYRDLSFGPATTGSSQVPEGPSAVEASPRRDQTLVGAESVAGAPPAAGDQPAADQPSRSTDDYLHDLLSRRIEELQRERQSRWQRILSLVVGN